MTASIDALSSSEAFIRALKSSHDPPTPSKICKIELANLAWSTVDLYIPGKAELLTEWIFTSLLKERGKASTLLDSRYWHLLASTCGSPCEKPWLPSVLVRIPVLPIFSRVFTCLHDSQTLSENLICSLALVFETVGPACATKANPDALLECFSALLRCLSTGSLQPTTSVGPPFLQDESSFSRLALLVLHALQRGFETVSSKKRILTSFLDGCLSDWAMAISLAQDELSIIHMCNGALVDVGCCILFSTETLRIWTDNLDTWQMAINVLLNERPHQAGLCLLPLLLKWFIKSMRQTPSVIPSSSVSHDSTVVTLRQTAGPLVDYILYLLLSRNSKDAWAARQHILQIALSERLSDVNNTHWIATITKQVQTAIVLLQNHGRTEHRVGCLEALHIIDLAFEMNLSLVDDHIDCVLLSCIHMGSDLDAAFESVLERILGFYSQTRSVHVILIKICNALSAVNEHCATSDDDICLLYFTGPLFSPRWELRLSSAMINYLTPGQASSVYQHINEALFQPLQEDYVHTITDQPHPGKRQKGSAQRKQEKHVPLPSTGLSLLSRYCVLLYRILLGWSTTQQTPQATLEQCESLVRRAFDVLEKVSPSESPTLAAAADDVLLSGLLRVVCIGFSEDPTGSIVSGLSASNIWSQIMKHLSSNVYSEELWTESFRLAVYILQKSPSEAESRSREVIDAFLQRMSQCARNVVYPANTTLASNNPYWHGCIFDTFALIDAVGTVVQIRRTAQLISEPSSGLSNLQPSLLSAASFWELRRLRHGFLLHAHQHCEPLLALDIQSLGTNSTSVLAASLPLHPVLSILDVLSLAPPAYFNKADLQWLSRALIVVDLLLICSKPNDQRNLLRVAKIRGLSASVLAELPRCEIPLDFVLREILLQSASCSGCILLIEATVRVIITMQRQLVSNLHLPSKQLKVLVTTYHDLTVRSFIPTHAPSSLLEILYTCLSAFFDLICQLVSTSIELPIDVQHELNALSEHVCTNAPLSVVDLGPACQPRACLSLVKAWSSASAFREWAGLPLHGVTLSAMAASTLRKVLDCSQPADVSAVYRALCARTFRVIVQGWKLCHREECDAQVNIICRKYSAMTGKRLCSEEADNEFAAACAILTVQKRIALVQNILRNWRTLQFTVHEAAADLRSVAILLERIPSGQDNHPLTDMVLEILCLQANIGSSVDSITHLLDFLITLSKTTSSLSVISIGHIWTVLGACLRPANSHSATPRVFSHIVMLLTTIIRTHRSLIVNSLPLLAHTLAALLLTLRTSRPFLGVHQSHLVANSQPWWVASDDPLGAEHAAELGRLLCTVVVRRPAQGYRVAESKLESLAKPFARHAPYLLKKYIDMVTDPFTTISGDMRRALQPGIFALCSMINDPDRDSLMLSLRKTPAKALFKAMWQEYDRQKYVGRG